MQKKGVLFNIFNLIKGGKPAPYTMEKLISDLECYDSSSAVKNLSKFTVEELNKGFVENAKLTHYPIFSAVGSDEKAFDKMVEMGVDIHALDKKGNNLFMHALEGGAYNWLDKIKDLGVDINTPNKNGDHPSHAAAKRVFDRKFVLKVADLGADFKVKDAKGRKASTILAAELRSTSKEHALYVPTKAALRVAKKAERKSLRFNK